MSEKSINKEVSELKEQTTAQLESAGAYTPLFDYQIEAVSIILTKVRLLMSVMSSDDYEPVIDEKSREGASRLKPNPCEKVLQDYLQILLRSLKALGMSSDAKPIKAIKRDFQLDNFLKL